MLKFNVQLRTLFLIAATVWFFFWRVLHVKRNQLPVICKQKWRYWHKHFIDFVESVYVRMSQCLKSQAIEFSGSLTKTLFYRYSGVIRRYSALMSIATVTPGCHNGAIGRYFLHWYVVNPVLQKYWSVQVLFLSALFLAIQYGLQFSLDRGLVVH